jgi:hypothetical protein
VTGPTGPIGPTGPAGGADGPFTRIQTVNWTHGIFGPSGNPNAFRELGLRIAFDTRDVFAEDLHDQSMVVQRRTESTMRDPAGNPITLVCWCEMLGRVEPGNFATLGDANSAFTVITVGQVNGVRFRPQEELRPGGQYRVLLKGDYVRALAKRAVDANHLPPWVGSGAAYRSGDGTEGGLFESWLTFRQ